MTINLQRLWRTVAIEAAAENKTVVTKISNNNINVVTEPHDYFDTQGHYIIDVYSYLAKSIANFNQLGFVEYRQKQILCYREYNSAIRIMHVYYSTIIPYRPEEFKMSY